MSYRTAKMTVEIKLVQMREGPCFFTFVIFLLSVNYLYFFVFCINIVYFRFVKQILERFDNDVMNEEGNERAGSIFHEQCRLEKTKGPGVSQAVRHSCPEVW